MKSASKCLILTFFLILQNCALAGFFPAKTSTIQSAYANYYASPSLYDFNPRFYEESSVFRSFLNVRITNQDSRVDKTEISVLKYKPEFRNDIERTFPSSSLPPYKIEIKSLTGQLEGQPGPTGFSVLYTVERTKVGSGNSLDSAWNSFKEAPYTRDSILRKEKWETITDGLWLSEESENFAVGSLRWKHKPGSLDFFHPITEFKSNNNLTASLYYDYNLNRFDKLKVEKTPDPTNLVFEGESSSVYFLNGQLTIRYPTE